MGFGVTIEAGAETLQNIHPNGTRKGAYGKSVFSFLSTLAYYDTFKDDDSFEDSTGSFVWFRTFEEKAGDITICRALIDCEWANGGDFTEYRESDYELFIARQGALRGDGVENTKELFLALVKRSREAYQPIKQVIEGVRFLLESFKKYNLDDAYFYLPEESYYLEDFEALLWNLEFLEKRGNRKVRLTFS